jgi:hypothetical protein
VRNTDFTDGTVEYGWSALSGFYPVYNWFLIFLLLLYFEDMSPTVLRIQGFRLYLFSREESRLHIHVQHATGEAKFWLTPEVKLAMNHGLKESQIATAKKLIMENYYEIRKAWETHFSR